MYKKQNLIFLLLCNLLLITNSSVSGISFGHIVATNPVIAVLSGLSSLGYIAYDAYKAYTENISDLFDTPDSVIFVERFYYEKRKTELEKTREELIEIKKELEV